MNYSAVAYFCEIVTVLAATSRSVSLSGKWTKGITTFVAETQAAFKIQAPLIKTPTVFYNETLQAIFPALELAEKLLVETGLPEAAEQLSFIIKRLKSNPQDLSSFPVELDHAIEAIVSAHKKQIFLYVGSKRKEYLDNPKLLGEAVSIAFPSAIPDIREAGNCLAAECNTAGVFHLMRAVEWGLRALCVDLGYRRVRKVNKKTGKVTYTPLGWSDWETLLSQLKGSVSKRNVKLKRGPTKQLYQEFYYPALEEIEAIKEAWRNHVMHTRSEYTSLDAEAILDHVKRLMSKLATRISEV